MTNKTNKTTKTPRPSWHNHYADTPTPAPPAGYTGTVIPSAGYITEVFAKSPQLGVMVESPVFGTFFITGPISPPKKASDTPWRIQGYKPWDNEDVLGEGACTAGTHLGWHFTREDCLDALSFILGEPVVLNAADVEAQEAAWAARQVAR